MATSGSPAAAPPTAASLASHVGNAASGPMLTTQADRQQPTEDAKRARPAVKRPKTKVTKNSATKKVGSVSSAYGTFTYAITKMAGAHGCDVSISFKAFAPEVSSTRVTLIQATESHVGGAVHYLNNDVAYYTPFDAGMYTDHLKGETDPFYNRNDATGTDEPVGKTAAAATSMTDTPRLNAYAAPHGQSFETAAFVLTGQDQGEFLGTLTWGWEVDAAGVFKLDDVVAHDEVSTVFGSALRKFIAQQHSITATGSTPTPITLTLPADVCRDLRFFERLLLLPTIAYAKTTPKARVWVVARYTDVANAAMAEYNAQTVQATLTTSFGVPADRVHMTSLEQPGVPKTSTPVEVTVINA